jgi:oxygen-dependent protoporphyrinogen oxidase
MGDLRDVIVVGAGIAGLAAAWDLRNRDVLVLEATDRLGGRIRSEPRDPYWLNLGAHVFAGPQTSTGRLISDVGVEAVEVPGTLTAMAMNGKLLTRGRVETYPFRLPMSWRDRAAILRAGTKVRVAVARYVRVAAPRDGETPADTQRRVMAHLNDRTFAEWVGELPPDVDAIFRPTVTRSTGDPEVLSAGHGVGYFALVWQKRGGLSRNIVGGSQELIDGIARELPGRIRTGVTVDEVVQGEDRVTVRANGEEIHSRHVVLATPAYEVLRTVRDLPAETAAALDAIPYGALCVMALLTDERGPVPWDGLYALATPKHPFTMVFNMANVLRPRSATRQPGGSLFLYRAGSTALELMEKPEDEVRDLFLEGLYDVLPELRGIVRETILLRLPRGLPYPTPGRADRQAALERPLGRIRLAGDYLGTGYTDTAVATGQAAARSIRTALQAEQAAAAHV